MLVPGRHGNSSSYRYGYNGMEKDDELKGEGNSYFTHHRLLDPRIGRWMSIDPEWDEYPDESPYTAMENNPMSETDPEGDCPWCIAALKGAAQEYGTQVISNFAEGKGWKEAFTDVDGMEIVKAGVEDGLTLGMAGLYKKAKTVVRVANAVDKANDAKKVVQKTVKVKNVTAKVAKVEKNVAKAEWKAKIVGKAQKTGTPGHRMKSYKEAINAAKKENVKKVHLDKGYNKISGSKPKTVSPNRRPDVSVEYNDGKIDAIEVQSKTDNPAELLRRNKEAMGQLPKQKQGSVKVVKPSQSE